MKQIPVFPVAFFILNLLQGIPCIGNLLTKSDERPRKTPTLTWESNVLVLFVLDIHQALHALRIFPQRRSLGGFEDCAESAEETDLLRKDAARRGMPYIDNVVLSFLWYLAKRN